MQELSHEDKDGIYCWTCLKPIDVKEGYYTCMMDPRCEIVCVGCSKYAVLVRRSLV